MKQTNKSIRCEIFPFKSIFSFLFQLDPPSQLAEPHPDLPLPQLVEGCTPELPTVPVPDTSIPLLLKEPHLNSLSESELTQVHFSSEQEMEKLG